MKNYLKNSRKKGLSKYRIEWKKSAVKELKSLPATEIKRIFKRIEQLKDNPFPPNYKKLKGTSNLYRIKEGDYRIVYSVEYSILLIEIIRVRHRKMVYRGL